MGAFKATRCRQTPYHHLLKIIMRMLHSRVIPAIHLFIRPLVVAIVIRLQFAVSLLSLFAGSRCSYVILSAMHVCSCVWGLSRPPDDSKHYVTALWQQFCAWYIHISYRYSMFDSGLYEHLIHIPCCRYVSQEHSRVSGSSSSYPPSSCTS